MLEKADYDPRGLELATPLLGPGTQMFWASQDVDKFEIKCHIVVAMRAESPMESTSIKDFKSEYD